MRAPWGPIMESIYTIVHTGRVGLPILLSNARILSMPAWEERTQKKKKNAVLDMQVQLVGDISSSSIRPRAPRGGRKSAFFELACSADDFQIFLVFCGEEEEEFMKRRTINTPNIFATSHRFPDTRDQYFMSSRWAPSTFSTTSSVLASILWTISLHA